MLRQGGRPSTFCRFTFPAIMGSLGSADCVRMGMTIYFYKVCEPYGAFSNFSEHSIDLEGKTWPSTEHYYQAQKFVGTPFESLCQKIHTSPTPAEAAALGRDPLHSVRSDWDEVKTRVMEKAVLQKFKTHSALRDLLLSTGDELIVEASQTDEYWGCGEDGQGQNHLGKILMHVRSQLRNSDLAQVSSRI